MRINLCVTLIILVVSCITFVFIVDTKVHATGCSTTISIKWNCGTTIYWAFTGGTFDSSAQAQIRSAFDDYNGISGVTSYTFVETPIVEQINFQVMAATVGPSPYQYNTMAITTKYSTGSKIDSAYTEFFLDETFTPPPAPSPAVHVFNSSAAYATPYSKIFKRVMLHEIGHTVGLQHPDISSLGSNPNLCDETNGATIMNVFCGVDDEGNNQPDSIQPCDRTNIAGGCPSPTPTPTRIAGYCQGAPDYGQFPGSGCATGFVNNGTVCDRSLSFQTRCAGIGYDSNSCTCPEGTTTSPIILDVDHSGFSLTSVANGVQFDLLALGSTQHIAWTAPSSTNAFLALDRNSNGRIDNGEELFGNVTPQPDSLNANGFLALAEYDKYQNGGNNDGMISSQDMIFPLLMLWQDTNHNGISETYELHTLSDLGLKSIDLDYKESKRTDEFGNQFRYRSKVKDVHGAQGGRWAWDVYLVTQP